MKFDFVKRALSKNSPFGKLAIMAAQRHVDDMKRQGTKDFPWVFSDEKALLYLNEFPKMPFWAGDRAGEPFELMPHFEFIIGSLFGWVHKDVGYNRFIKAYTELARGGAKSTLTGGAVAVELKLGLYPGSEYYSAATTQEQANFVYRAGRNLLKRHEDLKKVKENNPVVYQVGDDPEALIKFTQYTLEHEGTDSFFKAVASKTDTLDGKNPKIAIVDEPHQHRTPEVHDSLWSGMKKRRNVLLWLISTAGFNLHGIGKQQRDYAAKILKGVVQNDRYFSIIFTLDQKVDFPDLCALDEYRQMSPEDREKHIPEDDFQNPKVWIKANPGIEYDVPIRDMLESDLSEAVDGARLNTFKTKNMNIWCAQEETWIDIALWDENAAHPKPKRSDAYGAVDLAGVLDLTAAFFAVPSAPYMDVFCLFWTNQTWINDPDNPYAEQFRQWAADGWVKIQDELLTDYDEVREDILNFLSGKKLKIRTVGIEAGFEGHEFAKNLNKALNGRPIGQKHAKIVRIPMGNLTGAVNDFEALLRARRIRHGGNPVLRFCVSNVSIKTGYDGRKRQPVKGGGEHDKIDGIVAGFLAMNEVFRAEPRGKYGTKK